MNKKIIAAAIAASFAAPAAMAMDSNVTVYGHVRQSLDAIDTAATDEWQINDRNSRLGFKGSEDLGNGLKALFQMEFNVRASATGSGTVGHLNGSTAVTANRNTFVGLAGDFGTVLVGRHDTPHNMNLNKNNIFNDTIADLKDGRNIGSPFNWERIDGTIAYVSPSFSGLTAAIAIVPDETFYNGAGGDGLADHHSGALMYSNGGLYAGIGYMSLSTTPAIGPLDEWNLAVNYTMDAFKVGLSYEEAERGVNNDMETWVINGTYTMGNNVLKAQYYNSDCDTALCESDSFALGLQHNLSKRTNAVITYVDVDADANSADTDGDAFSIGLNHSF